MEQGGFDDLFRSASVPAVNNPFDDGDNPFADVPSRTADPWASFYAQQPPSPSAAAPSVAPDAPPTLDRHPDLSGADPTVAHGSLTYEDHAVLQSPVDTLSPQPSNQDFDLPPQSSALSPPFREVYEVDSPSSDASSRGLPRDVTPGTDSPALAYLPSHPHSLSNDDGLASARIHNASASSIPQGTYEAALPSSPSDNASSPIHGTSTVSPATPITSVDRKSTTDLISSLLSETSSPSSPFRKSAFKPPPTPRKRVVAEEPKQPAPKAEPVDTSVPVSKPAPKGEESVATPSDSQASHTSVAPPPRVATPVIQSESLHTASTEPLPAVSSEPKEGPRAYVAEIWQAAATPLPPSLSVTPTYIATPNRVSTPTAVSIAIPTTLPEPPSPATSNMTYWGLRSSSSATALDDRDRAFLSPLEAASSVRAVMDRTTSDITLPGVDEQGWYGDQSTRGPGRWDSENGMEVSNQVHEAEPSTVSDTVHDPSPSLARRRRVDSSMPNTVVTVGDPQKVGDPINAHIVYTVHTTTEAVNLFRKTSFSVLRRYSDFLWLFETLQLNNPGIIVPPVPEKHSFGRFEENFVESRRQALNRCIQKIVDHPLLFSDPALKMFLESDSFALDIKHRKAELSVERAGLMASIGSTLAGPKFVESDEWFENRRTQLDALESQLRALVKAIDVVAKHRADVAAAANELSESLLALAGSSLNRHLSHSLGTLADLQSKAKDLQEAQSKDDVLTFLFGIEEYTRLIGSIRVAFSSREKVYLAWQNAEADVRRVRVAHEKAKRQGKLPSDRTGVSLVEVAQAERRALDTKQEYESVTKLIKTEFTRFELERIEDFKDALNNFVEHMIRREGELISLWEHYQTALARRAGEPHAQNGINVHSAGFSL